MTMNHSQIREKARIEVLETVKEIHDYLLKKKEWFKAFQLVQEVFLIIKEDSGERKLGQVSQVDGPLNLIENAKKEDYKLETERQKFGFLLNYLSQPDDATKKQFLQNELVTLAMSDNMKEIINVKIMELLQTKNSKFVKRDREYL